MIFGIGAATTAILFILQVVGIISISGWLILTPLLLGLAWVVFWMALVFVFALIANN